MDVNRQNNNEPEYDNCFVCGKNNSRGLKLEFSCDQESAWVDFTLDSSLEGYPGIIHGGIVATLLDEVMAKVLLFHGVKAVTTRMCTEYKKPVETDKKYRVRGVITRERSRIVDCEANITDENGNLRAKAEASFYRVRE